MTPMLPQQLGGNEQLRGLGSVSELLAFSGRAVGDEF